MTDTGRESSTNLASTTPGDTPVAVDPTRTDTTPPQPTATPPHASPATATATATAAPQSEGLRKVIPIAALVLGGIAWSISAGSFPVVAFILAIIAMIMIHETGHFITAKWAGMKVTEYFFGFGPRLWSIRRGETEYGIKALPLGGYVKITGMSNLERDIDPADEPRTYRQQSYPKRVLVAIAGVVTHFVAAFLLLVLLWTMLGVPQADKPTLTIGSISGLETGAAPALDAGFEVGDRIVSVDGRTPQTWAELPPYIRERAGQNLAFVVERDGQLINLTARPAGIEQDGATIGFIGIGARPEVEKLGLIDAVGRSGQNVWDLTAASVKGLGTIFTPNSLRNYAGHLTGTAEPGTEDQRPVSLVGVSRLAGQAAESGAFNVVYLLVVLNLFVAVLNLVPLLPFDGGHIAVATYERLRSRRGRRYHADVGKLMPLTAAVVVVMVLLGVTSIYLDIVNPLGNPFQ